MDVLDVIMMSNADGKVKIIQSLQSTKATLSVACARYTDMPGPTCRGTGRVCVSLSLSVYLKNIETPADTTCRVT